MHMYISTQLPFARCVGIFDKFSGGTPQLESVVSKRGSDYENADGSQGDNNVVAFINKFPQSKEAVSEEEKNIGAIKGAAFLGIVAIWAVFVHSILRKKKKRNQSNDNE